ncbi:MAG: ATP-binding protein [Thermoplasmata archaeon]|nr:ATP-binding protein [Thermoplasmata archaeon]
MKFVGREWELGCFNDHYGEPSAFAIYGRRRIGKTRLMEHFCEGKRSIYINCLMSGFSENLVHFADIISDFTGKPKGPYRSFRDVLADLYEIAKESTTVIIIDEYPNLLDGTEDIPTLIQGFIDTKLKTTTSMLFVSGSSISVMKRQLAGDKPLFDRYII